MAEGSVSSNVESSQKIVLSIQVSVSTVARSRSDSGGIRRSFSRRRSSSSGSLLRRRTSNSMPGNGSSPPNMAPSKGAWLPASLVLTETKLYYDVDGASNVSINLVDVIGVQIIRKPPLNNPSACEMDVNYYPLVPAGRSGKQTRKLSAITVQFDADSEFRNNLITAMEWRKKIKLHVRRAAKVEFCSADTTSSQLSEDESLLVPRRLLVFINPVGGKGTGVSDFKQHVQPLFDMAEINCNIVVTDRANHARDIVKDCDVTQIDGIVISSGDGLLYEVVNGLMEREDWETALKTPIGMLPTGSGNALVASTLHEANEEYSLMNAAFQIIRGGVAPLDVATVQTGDGGKCYMTLLANWGIVADVDIESEKFRKIGETRFILGALNCIIKRRLYMGKLSYLPADPTEQSADSNPSNVEDYIPPKQSSTISTDTSQKDTDMTDVAASPGDMSREDGDVTPSEQQSDQCDGEGESEETLPQQGDDETQQESSEATASTEQEKLPDSDTVGALSNSDKEKEEERELKREAEIKARVHYHPFGPKPHLLSSSLSEPVPSSWKTLETEFVGIAPLMVPCMAHGFYGDPTLRIGSGNIRILILENSLSRKGLFGLMTGTESGKHIGMDGLELIDVKAYRLEPLTSPGMLTLDGEEIFYGPHQVQVHAGLARVMCRIKKP